MYLNFIETMSCQPFSEQIIESLTTGQLYALLVSMKVRGAANGHSDRMANELAKRIDLNLEGVEHITDYTLQCMKRMTPLYRPELPEGAFSLTPLIYNEHPASNSGNNTFNVTILPMALYYGAASGFSFDLQVEAGISPLRLNEGLQQVLGEEYEFVMEGDSAQYTNHSIRKRDGSDLSPEEREFIRNRLNDLEIRDFDAEVERMHLPMPEQKYLFLSEFTNQTSLHDGILSITFQSKEGEHGNVEKIQNVLRMLIGPYPWEMVFTPLNGNEQGRLEIRLNRPPAYLTDYEKSKLLREQAQEVTGMLRSLGILLDGPVNEITPEQIDTPVGRGAGGLPRV